jgi:hypothetical protein
MDFNFRVYWQDLFWVTRMPRKDAAAARWLAFAQPDMPDNEPSGFELNGIPLSGRSFRLMFRNDTTYAALRNCGG